MRVSNISSTKLVELDNLINNELLDSITHSKNSTVNKQFSIIPTKFVGLGLPDVLNINICNNYTSNKYSVEIVNSIVNNVELNIDKHNEVSKR